MHDKPTMMAASPLLNPNETHNESKAHIKRTHENTHY
jgi:hypothetical protein